MKPIPPEIYARVHQFAVDLTNASVGDDEPLYQSLYETLKSYCEEQDRAGVHHPFLLETLADFTEDNSLSVAYYHQALTLARETGDAAHTILVALGERLCELGRQEQAEAFLRDGKAEAIEQNDPSTAKHADELLREMP